MSTLSDVEQVTDDDFSRILKAASDFVRERVVPRESEIMDGDAIPDDIRQAAADLGLFGYAIPQEWGGLGLNLIQDVELAMEFGYTSLVGSSRVDLQACKLEYSIVSPK